MTLRDQMQNALKGHGADFVEIRLEESDSSRIQYRAREIEEIGRTSGRGGSVRAAVKGGWGFVSFNDTDDLESRVKLAVEQAKAVGSEKTELADTEPSVADVPPVLVNDPGNISLSDKKDRMDHYNDLIWSTPGIQSSTVIYGDNKHKSCVFFFQRPQCCLCCCPNPINSVLIRYNRKNCPVAGFFSFLNILKRRH